MKELFAVFGSDVLKSVVTLLIPGFLAIAPYIAILKITYERISNLLQASSFETLAVLVGIALFVALLLDDFGSHIEAGWDDQCPDKHTENWFRYLRWTFEKEPIGHRYLRNLVVRLKFELAAYGALLLAAPGAAFLIWHYVPWPSTLLTSIVVAALTWWLRIEAKETFRTLSRLRAHMLLGLAEGPASVPQPRQIEDECLPPATTKQPWAWASLALSVVALFLFLEPLLPIPSPERENASPAYYLLRSTTWVAFLCAATAVWCSYKSIRVEKEESRLAYFGAHGVLSLLLQILRLISGQISAGD